MLYDESDVGFYFVGKIFDRPMRTRKEELEFCYGNMLEEDNPYGAVTILNNSKSPSGKPSFPMSGKKVKFDWIPHDVSERLARLYLNQIPKSAVPIEGSQGAHFRQQVRTKLSKRKITKIM